MAMIWDPTFDIQPRTPAPVTRGSVVGDLGGSMYSVIVDSRQRTCMSAGQNAIASGTSVSVILGGPVDWIISADQEYESRKTKPLSQLQSEFPASSFFLYMLRNNPKNHLYLTVEYLGAGPTSSTASARFPDGHIRAVEVEYGDNSASLGGHSVGDPVLVYQKTKDNWTAIGTSGGQYIYWISWVGINSNSEYGFGELTEETGNSYTHPGNWEYTTEPSTDFLGPIDQYLTDDNINLGLAAAKTSTTAEFTFPRDTDPYRASLIGYWQGGRVTETTIVIDVVIKYKDLTQLSLQYTRDDLVEADYTGLRELTSVNILKAMYFPAPFKPILSAEYTVTMSL